MKRSRGPLALALSLAAVLGSVATASAVILMTVVSLLTLFAIVGLTFAMYVDVQVVADPPDGVTACDIAISILDEQGQIVASREARVRAGELLTLQHRSRSGPGVTEAIRAVVKSRTVPPHPSPPDPCPILASLQLVDGSTGRTEAVMLPAQQRTLREAISRP